MKRFLTALQFLTIIPVAKDMTVDEDVLVGSAPAFVVVGMIQGILLIAVEFAAGKVFNHDLVAGIILLALVLTNGGFHLDGLADTFDALAAGGDRVKKLSVMKDGAAGPIGVIAVFFVLLFKFLALNNLSAFPSFLFYSSLFLMPVFSKWSMVVSMSLGKPARKEGLGRIFINGAGFYEAAASTLILLLSLISLQAFSGLHGSYGQYIFYAISLTSIFFLCFISTKIFSRRFGGLTGDTLGAVSEITEAAFLFMAVGWSRLFI